MQKDLEDCLFLPEKVEEKRLFRAFLEKRFAVENIDFVERVTAYKNAKVGDREGLARDICDTFIAQGSGQEVNLEEGFRVEIFKALEDRHDVHSDGRLFDKALDSILFLLASDCYPSFRVSPTFKAHLRNVSIPDQSLTLPTSSSAFSSSFTAIAIVLLFLVTLN